MNHLFGHRRHRKIGGTREKEQNLSKVEDGFINPPAESRPHTFWIWMNSNITWEGITADLEAMARFGIGGVPSGLIGPVSLHFTKLVKVN